MTKQSKRIQELPTLEDMTVPSSLLDTIEEAENKKPDGIEEEEEKTDETPKDDKKPEDEKKKDKLDETPKEDDVLTEEEEKEIFETLKGKDSSEFNEAEKEIFDKYSKEQEPDGSFWEDVEAITGTTVEVDYGDTDPETPEGAALREEALVQQVQEDQLKYLETTYPEAFKILQHYANGGNVQDLINPGEVDYSVVAIKEDNSEQQKRFLTDYYINVKGLSDTKAKKMVELDEESDTGLYKTAQDALEELKTAQDTRKQEALEEQKLIAEEQKARDVEFVKAVRGITDKGEIGSFKVPTKEIEEFNKVVFNRFQRDNQGGYVYVVPITNQTITPLLQEAYFGYKKGDLSSLVKKQATTENIKRLKRKAVEDQKKILKSTLKRKQDVKGLPTFDDITQ